MAKTAQVLSSLNENFFDFFDFAVKKFCGSRIALRHGVKAASGCCRIADLNPLAVAYANRYSRTLRHGVKAYLGMLPRSGL
jgi:hypothetical protein